MPTQPLSLQELITLLDPQKPLTTSVAKDVLEFVGLNETMLLEISNQQDANERLDSIRLIVKQIASGQPYSYKVGEHHQLPVAIWKVGLEVSNKHDTTDPTRIH